MENEVKDLQEDEYGLEDLGKLKVPAPKNTFERLQKRVKVAQVTKDLVEKQAFAFWTVIDAFLRLIFVPNKNSTIEKLKNTGEEE